MKMFKNRWHGPIWNGKEKIGEMGIVKRRKKRWGIKYGRGKGLQDRERGGVRRKNKIKIDNCL
jgi:hypothetical protein